MQPVRRESRGHDAYCTLRRRRFPQGAQADHHRKWFQGRHRHREPSGACPVGGEVEEFLDLMQWLNAPVIVYPQGSHGPRLPRAAGAPG